MSQPEDLRDDFYRFLNVVSGFCQEVEVSKSMCGMGGVKSYNELLSSCTGFKLATIEEFNRFHNEGYTGGDFQHIFLDAFLTVRFDTLIS
jgi:hypothetical protein